MIFQAAERALREAGARPGNEVFLIRLSIPEGAALAARTFNPRLGIEGGISVLGTSGIVKPMSEEALLDTIRLEIHMKAAEGRRRLILTPGNYGERFLKELGLPEDAAVLCSNFIRDAAVCAAEEGFERILLAGHIGKLIKIAGGAPKHPFPVRGPADGDSGGLPAGLRRQGSGDGRRGRNSGRGRGLRRKTAAGSAGTGPGFLRHHGGSPGTAGTGGPAGRGYGGGGAPDAGGSAPLDGARKNPAGRKWKW